MLPEMKTPEQPRRASGAFGIQKKSGSKEPVYNALASDFV
jgi:hypothetical protein